MSFIEKNILGIASPVYGRRAFQLKVLPFTIDETARMLHAWPLEDIASAHAITGGIPYYLSFLKAHASLQEAINLQCRKLLIY